MTLAMAQTEFLKFSDKIYFNSTHYQGALSLYYQGNQCAPVVDQQKTEFPKHFERCVYQILLVRTQEQQNFLWGEAAETAKYVSYGQVVKLWNVFSNRCLTCDTGTPDDDENRLKATMSTPVNPVNGKDDQQQLQQLFRILPKYKIREVGERVRMEDQIVIESVVSGLYMHATSITTSLTSLWKSHQESVMESRGVTPAVQHFVDFQGREQKGAAWQMAPYETDKDRDTKNTSGDQLVMAGSAVVVYHREAEGFLLCDWQVQDAEHAYIDHHKIQKATFNVLDLPYSSNALWILEAEQSKKGGAVMYQRHRKYYRLKHMATGLYLTLNCWNLPDGTRMRDVSTTYSSEDKNTLLSISPLDTHDQSDALTINSFARLCFYHEEVWLHSTGEYSVDEPTRISVSQADHFKSASLGTTGKLQRVETTTKGYYEDVFAIRVVNADEKESLTQVCNMVITLQRFHQYWKDLKQEREQEKKAIQDRRNQRMQRGMHTDKKTVKIIGADGEPTALQNDEDLDEADDANGDLRNRTEHFLIKLKKNTKSAESSKLIYAAQNAIRCLVLFCTNSVSAEADPFSHLGPPVRKHQRMLFQQNVHNLIFYLLKAPLEFGGLTTETIMRLDKYSSLCEIYALAYRLIKLMVKGEKDMAGHMASFLPFIESQLGDMTSIADAYMQIICDNDRLLETLNSLQLESFLWLIPQFGRKPTYMTLLSACCTCEGEGIARNQLLLVRRLRNMEKLSLMYPCKLVGDTIKIRHIVGFPGNTERKIRRFKRRRESGDEDSDDASSESDTDSEEEERTRAQSPYAMRYSPRSRSASPQAALLSVAYNIPPAMQGCWVFSIDTPCVVPTWKRFWLRCTGGCLLFARSHDDNHPRTIPLYMFQRAKKDGVSSKAPPEGLGKNGISLIYKAPKGVTEEDEHERRTLLCTENAQDRLELLMGLRREIKHAANVDDFDQLELNTQMHAKALDTETSTSLGHMRAQMSALRVRNNTGGELDEAAADDSDDHLWQDLEKWILEADEEDNQFFEQSLTFLASLCVGGNEPAIHYVRKRFSSDVILAGINLQVNHPLCDTIRCAFVRLARHMFIEAGMHTRTSKEVISRIKDTVYDYILRNTRQQPNLPAKNRLLAEILDLAHVVITAGCYSTEELEHLFHPLLRLLDGTSDLICENFLQNMEVQTQRQLQSGGPPASPGSPQGGMAPHLNLDALGSAVAGVGEATPASPRDPGSPLTQASRKNAHWSQFGDIMPQSGGASSAHLFEARFSWSEQMQLVINCKLGCCRILQWLFTESATNADIDVPKWVHRISKMDRRLGKHPEGRFLSLQTDLLTQILLDVTLYKGYPLLFRTALQLALANISGAKGDATEIIFEDDENAIKGLAELLKTDLIHRNSAMTMNLFRHFRESKEDSLTIILLRVFKTMIYLSPGKRDIERMQCLLDGLGVTPIVTQMIESKDEHVVSEALQFGHALLQGGNRMVQKAIFNYFLSLNDEAFFSCTKDRIGKAISLIKNTESSEKHQKSKLATKQDKTDPNQSTLIEGNANDSVLQTSSIHLNETNHRYKDCELFHLEKVLRFLQLFCEGHNEQLQEYLREQDDNVHTYNLVKETIVALKHLLTIEHHDLFIFSHVLQAFNTLTEYCQGPCHANQLTLVNANVAYEVNVVLARPLPLVSLDSQDELKNAALTVLLSVVEGVEDPHIPNVITRTLDFKLINALLTDIWARRKEENALDLGFTCFMLLRTLATFDFVLNDYIEKVDGFSFYTALTGRIEIFRDGALVRVYFRIPFICANLSNKTKDELLWNVKRDTPTARIADFYDRAEELIYEIEFYEKCFKESGDERGWWDERLRKAKYLVNSTISLWENSMIVLAFVINGLVCGNYVTDMSNPDKISRRPLEGFKIESDLVLLLLKVLIFFQFIVCIFLLFDFCVAKAPLIAHKRKKKERQLMMKRARKKFSLKRYIEMFEVDHPELGGTPHPGAGTPLQGPSGGDVGSPHPSSNPNSPRAHSPARGGPTPDHVCIPPSLPTRSTTFICSI